MKIRNNESGFGAVEAAIILIVIIVVGGVGWLVYKNNHKGSTENTSTSTTQADTKHKTAKAAKTVDPYAGWSTYTSKAGGFTLRYPSSWIIEGYTGTYGSTTVPAGQMTGNESSFDIMSTTSKTNAFDVWFTIGDSASSKSSLNSAFTELSYSQGTVIKNLANGIGIWQAAKTLNINGHINPDTYPPSETVSNGKFGFKLSNGKYLDATMAFMTQPGYRTTYSYDQQINSKELKQGITVLASITQD